MSERSGAEDAALRASAGLALSWDLAGTGWAPEAEAVGIQDPLLVA